MALGNYTRNHVDLKSARIISVYINIFVFRIVP
jgi:hypothetical protein